MFKSSAPPAPAPPPPADPPPSRADSIVVQNEQRDRVRRKLGPAAMRLTSPGGDTTQPMTSAAQLLGQ